MYRGIKNCVSFSSPVKVVTQGPKITQNTNELPHYFEVTEEGRGVLQFPLNVEGDHPRTSGALSLHQLMLGVWGQAYVERENMEQSAAEDRMFLLHSSIYGQHSLLKIPAV